MANINPLKVLRPLGKGEISFASERGSFNNLVNCLIVTSKIDLNANPSLIKRAIEEWKRLHPLLNAKIEKNDEQGQFLFVLAQDEKLQDSMHNVKLLSFEDDSSELTSTICHLLFELETTMNLNVFEELLWRIKFFKLNEGIEKECAVFKYAVIFTIHHCITDRRNKYMNLLELLSIIEQMHDGKYVQKPKYDLIDSLEVIFKDVQVKDLNYWKQEELKFPSKPNIFKTNPEPHRNLDALQTHVGKFILTNENEKYISLQELIDKTQKNLTKCKTMCIKDSLFLSFVNKCKENDIKLNGVLNALICLAIKKFYLEQNEPLDEMAYINSIDLRQFTGNKDKFRTFSYMANSIIRQTVLKSNDLDESLQNFWSFAKQESINLHQRLDNNEYTVRVQWSMLSKFTDDMLFSHYFFANLGALPSKFESTAESDSIRVKESYELYNVGPYKAVPFDLNAISIDNRLYLTFIYDSYFASHDVISRFSEIILELFDKLSNF